MRPTNLIQPFEGQWEPNLSPALTKHVKKESHRSPKKVKLPDLDHSNTIDRSRNPNFICDFEESRHQLNISSFHETSNRRQINTQRDLLSKRIDLEASPSRQREERKLRKPKRLVRNRHNNRDNSHQY